VRLGWFYQIFCKVESVTLRATSIASTRLHIIEHFLECISRQEQRVSANLAKKIVSFALSQLKHYGPSTQQLTIEKALSHSMIMDSLPPYSIDLVAIKQSHEEVQHLKDEMNTHFVGLQ